MLAVNGPILVVADVCDLLRTLPPNSVDLLSADPDYGVAVWQPDGTLGRDQDWIADDTDDSHYLEWYDLWVSEVKRVLRPGGSAVIWGNREMTVLPLIKRHLRYKTTLLWIKTNPRPFGNQFNSSFEAAVWAVKNGASYTYNFERGQNNHNFIMMPQTPVQERFGHRTSKNWRVMAWYVERLTRLGDLVVDPFVGSGSSAFAAVSLGRRFIGGDLDPQWVEVTKRRLEGLGA